MDNNLKSPYGFTIDPKLSTFPTTVEEVAAACERNGHLPDVCACHFEGLRLPLLAYARAKREHVAMHERDRRDGDGGRHMSAEIIIAFCRAEANIAALAEQILVAEEERLKAHEAASG